MQCRSSPEGPPSRCFDPTFSVSPGCGGQDIQDPYGISLRSAPRPVVWHPCCRPPSGGRGNHPPPVGSSEIWHSPPGSAQPYQEDPGRSTQLITHPLCLSCLASCPLFPALHRLSVFRVLPLSHYTPFFLLCIVGNAVVLCAHDMQIWRISPDRKSHWQQHCHA